MEEKTKGRGTTFTERAYDRLRTVFSKRGLVLLIVTIALFLDNMLLTTVGKLKTNTLLHNIFRLLDVS